MNYEKLEVEYAKFVGTRYAVAVSSGTAALHLSLIALGIGPGDEVIVPDFTMAACGFAVSYVGAKVVTVDCGDDYNIDVFRIIEKITPRTKAIMAVHIYGRLCNMKIIRSIADSYGLKIIEDGCEAQGAAKGGNSDCLVFSFYRNKIIHAEEGGIVCTDSEEIYKDIKDLKNMSFGGKHDYYHARIGFNYRMPESQASMALESLKQYPQNNEKRREIENNFYLGTVKHDAVWVLDVEAGSEKKRDIIVKNDNHTRKFFKPLSSMPMWKQDSGIGIKALRYSQIGFYRIINIEDTMV